MGVANAPTLVMLDPNNKLQAFVEQEQPNLDVILSAFLDGWIENRDLAQEKLTDYQFHRNRFISQLHLLACDRIARDQLPKIETFPPLILQRKPLWTKPSSEPFYPREFKGALRVKKTDCSRWAYEANSQNGILKEVLYR